MEPIAIILPVLTALALSIGTWLAHRGGNAAAERAAEQRKRVLEELREAQSQHRRSYGDSREHADERSQPGELRSPGRRRESPPEPSEGRRHGMESGPKRSRGPDEIRQSIEREAHHPLIALMPALITLVVLGASLYVILSKSYETDTEKWAFGCV